MPHRPALQGAEPCFGGFLNFFCLGALRQQEHPDAAPGQVGLEELKILLIGWRLVSPQLVVCSQAFAVAQLDVPDAGSQQAFYDARGQLQRKAVPYNIAAIPEGVVK